MNIILFEEIELGAPLSARDERTLHLRSVLRKKAGDTFVAGVLGGNRGTGVIERINPDGSLSYTLTLGDPPAPRTPVRMALGLVRPIQLRRILRDMANLGVTAIDLMGTELGEKSYKDATLLSRGGARNALIQGAVQARDTRLPILAVYPSLRAWLGAAPWDPSAALVAADNERAQGVFSGCRLTPDTARDESGEKERIALAVGSERGWSDTERRDFEAAGFRRLSLGSRVLRTETACVAAVVLAMLAMEKIGEPA